jgi:glutaconate CoA-transferase, subunit B
MTDDVADLTTVCLARELVDACADGVRVLAVTSGTSLVAGLAARRLGAPDLATAVGFGILDAVDPRPAVTLGEAALGVDGAWAGHASDTFVAVARGLVGVAVTPAQLDGTGATNLSRVGGTDDAPGVALPGSRGLPDNNDSPSRVWYVLPTHSPRTLVEAVDFVSGPPPSPGRARRLITPLGVFALRPGAGWSAVSLTHGVTAEDVARATGFPVTVGDDVATTAPVSNEERAALEAVDAMGLRRLEYLPGQEAAALYAQAAAAEAG